MAIRKDLDDMLNNLKGNSPENSAPSKTETTRHKSIYDNMSVDDLLNALTVEKKPSLAENIINEIEDKENKEADASAGKAPDVQETSEFSAPEQKKKVVITGELPDYEEIRRIEEQEKQNGHILAEGGRDEFITVNESEPETEISVSDIVTEEYHVQPVEKVVRKEKAEHTDKSDENAQESGNKKKGLFSKRRKKHSDYDNGTEQNFGADDESDIAKNDDAGIGNESENGDVKPDTDEPAESADNLIEAALAAINSVSEADENIAESVEEEENGLDTEFEPEEENNSGEKDGVKSLIEDIRENAANAIAEIEEHSRKEESGKKKERRKKSEKKSEEFPEKEDKYESVKEREVSMREGKITAALTNILEEDPETLIDVKREKTEESEDTPLKKKKMKKRLYAVFGVIFTIFAVIGIVTAAGKGVKMFRSFTSGETKKDGFTELVYPMVIMDIESFDKPSSLTSEQIITAAVWSIIMNDEKLEKYPVNAAGGDVIQISAYDVEAEAVALFGQDHAEFIHTTVGPVEARFYYDPDKGVYNVPIHPIVFTYEPEIKSIVKSGSKYTITVDYIDERPSWMEKSVSKSVEFHVTEKSDGTYQFDSMNIIYVKNNL